MTLHCLRIDTATDPRRYRQLQHIALEIRRWGGQWLGFGLRDDHGRLVVEGCADPTALVRALSTQPQAVSQTRNLQQALLWAHRAPRRRDPLASPWSSHRDLMGLRSAVFFDGRRVTRRLGDPNPLHRALGGRSRHRNPRVPPTTTELLRVSAEALGLDVGHRSSFGLYVQLGRTRGRSVRDLSRDLLLTERRVRQLSHVEVQGIEAANRLIQSGYVS